MAGVFEVRTAGQLRVIAAPARRAVVEALMGVGPAPSPASAREVGARAGLSPEAAHYHLGRLAAVGLVVEAGERRTGARPEKLFALVSDRIELRRGRRGSAYVRELSRAVRLLLGRAAGEYAAAAPDGAFATPPRVGRAIGWMTPEELGQAERLLAELEGLVRAADERAHAEGLEGCERVAVTAVVAPVERAGGPGRT